MKKVTQEWRLLQKEDEISFADYVKYGQNFFTDDVLNLLAQVDSFSELFALQEQELNQMLKKYGMSYTRMQGELWMLEVVYYKEEGIENLYMV